MATPTEWTGPFQVNTGSAEAGTQDNPHIIGLANGSFVVAWDEGADGAVGTSTGRDIVAKIFDADGTVLRDAFQLNQAWTEGDEFDFDLTATHDGFALAAIHREGDGTETTTTVVYERFDFDGDSADTVNQALVIAEHPGVGNLNATPSLIANLLSDNDDTFIAYVERVNGDRDIKARVISETDALGAPFNAAQNFREFDRAPDTAVLSNGNFVTVYEEKDGPNVSLEFTLRRPDGTAVGSSFEAVTTGSGGFAAPKVAALSDGGFVVTYSRDDNVFARLFTETGDFLGDAITVRAGPNVQSEASVTALPDGDFVVAWIDVTAGQLFGQRFNPDGSRDGSLFAVATGNPTDLDIGTTGDGRLLLSWRDVGEVFASIWDPRPATIDPADYADETANILRSTTITTGLGNATVLEGAQGDRVLGQGGNDWIFSSGSGSYSGGGGNDYLLAGPSAIAGDTEILDGGDGFDFVDTSRLDGDFIINLATGFATFAGAPEGQVLRYTNFEVATTGDGDDTVVGTDDQNEIRTFGGDDVVLARGGDDVVFAFAGDDLVLGESGNDSLWGGGGSDSVRGGAGDDRIEGDDGSDTLFGGDGNDALDGGSGNDLLDGDAGNDFLGGWKGDDVLRGRIGDDFARGGDGADTVFGGGGNDTIEGEAADDFLDGGLGNDTIRGGFGNDVIFGIGDDDMLYGDGGSDRLAGGSGNDTLFGGEGADKLYGGPGNDILVGGLAQDILEGMAGDDVFRFFSFFESPGGTPDIIHGMDGVGRSGGDVIDLSAIDADPVMSGDQAFTFIGVQTQASGFAAGAGSLWVLDFNGQTRVYGNVDGDITLEFALRINDGADIAASDYIASDFIL